TAADLSNFIIVKRQNKRDGKPSYLTWLLIPKRLHFVDAIFLPLHEIQGASMGTVMKAVLFIGSFFIQTAVFAQQEIKVSDPDIYFSFLLPEHWKVLDDHYTYYIAPSGDPIEYYMAFTYAGEKSDVEKNKLDETVRFKLDYVYPQNTPGFRLVETGDTHIDGKPAKWIKFHSTVDGARYTN